MNFAAKLHKFHDLARFSLHFYVVMPLFDDYEQKVWI